MRKTRTSTTPSQILKSRSTSTAKREKKVSAPEKSKASVVVQIPGMRMKPSNI